MGPRGLAVACSLAAFALAGCGGGEPDEVRFLVFGDPEEIQAYRTLISAYERRDDAGPVQLIEASDREDLLAGSQPPSRAAPRPTSSSSTTASTVSSRPGMCWSRSRNGSKTPRVRAGRLLPAGARGVPLGGGADLPAAERLQPGRLLQPRPLPSLPRGRAEGRLDLDRVHHPRRESHAGCAGQPGRGDPELGAVRPAIFGLGIEPTIIRLAPLVWSNGGELVDDPDRPTRFALESPRPRWRCRSS